MEWYEAAFDRFYPILYSHRDTEEAFRAIETFTPYFEGKSPILDLASGSGRYLEALVAGGFEAFGVDLSLYLLGQSVDQYGHRGRLVQGDMRFVPILDESVGGVLNMFTSFGYFSVDMDNLLVLREIHRVLRPGGVFLFDFINAEKISSELLSESERESAGYDIYEKRRMDEHGKYLVKHATIVNQKTKDREEIEERLRLYSKADLLTMIASVELKVVEVFGDYAGNEFVPGVSERVIIVAEKK
jgi:SAM-dependent methyltransferase